MAVLVEAFHIAELGVLIEELTLNSVRRSWWDT
jgi:hypothetical protein